MQMTYQEAWENVGGLSQPSKMPCYGWSISAKRCNVGGKLAKVTGSICEGCYALRGNYMFKNVQNALDKRFAKLHTKMFVPSMVLLLKCLGQTHFRLYDSGDLDSVETLDIWAEIARQLPDTRFWLPTKEYGVVTKWLAKNACPPNLTIRLSSYMVDKAGPNWLAARLGLTTSEVRREGFTCPASTQGNNCLTCRQCWDQKVQTVVYKKH